MIRNHLLRETLNANPGLMGLLHVLARTADVGAHSGDGRNPDILRRLENIERALGASAVDINVIRKRTAPWSRAIETQIKSARTKLSKWFSAGSSNA
jgi:hypothetical protein